MSIPTAHKPSFFKTLAEVLRAMLSVLLVILFVLVLTFTLLGQDSYTILRQPESYTTLADQTHLAVRLRGLVVSILVSSVLDNSGQWVAIDVSQVPPQTWDNIAAVILPAAWLNSAYNNLTQTLIVWINGPAGSPLIFNFDMTSIKQTLQSDQGAAAILPILQTAPACAPGEQPQIGQGSLISCLPDGQDLSFFAGQAALVFAQLLPEQISLQSDTIIPPAMLRYLEKVRYLYKAAGLGLALALRISVLVLALYALLQSDSLRRMLLNLGWPLYTAAMALLLLSGIFTIATHWGFDLVIPASLAGSQPDLRALLIDLGRTATAMLQPRLLVAAAALTGAAVVVQLLAFALGKWQASRQARTQPVRSNLQR